MTFDSPLLLIVGLLVTAAIAWAAELSISQTT